MKEKLFIFLPKNKTLRSESVNFTKKLNKLNFSIAGSGEITVNKLTIPSHVSRGDRVKMTCDYDLRAFKLYSIKWYKDDEEIFRYIPSSRPAKQALEVVGVNIDVSIPFQLILLLAPCIIFWFLFSLKQKKSICVKFGTFER